MELVTVRQMLFGSDYPFSRQTNPEQDVRDTIKGFEAFGGWDAATRRGIEHDNALKLLPRLAQAIAKKG